MKPLTRLITLVASGPCPFVTEGGRRTTSDGPSGPDSCHITRTSAPPHAMCERCIRAWAEGEPLMTIHERRRL